MDDAALRELATGPLIQRLHLASRHPGGLDECTREMFALAMLVRMGKVTEGEVLATFDAFAKLDPHNEGVLNSKSIIAGMIQRRKTSSLNLHRMGQEHQAAAAAASSATTGGNIRTRPQPQRLRQRQYQRQQMAQHDSISTPAPSGGPMTATATPAAAATATAASAGPNDNSWQNSFSTPWGGNGGGYINWFTARTDTPPYEFEPLINQPNWTTVPSAATTTTSATPNEQSSLVTGQSYYNSMGFTPPPPPSSSSAAPTAPGTGTASASSHVQ